VGCYIWYSEEGIGRDPSPPRPLLSIPNVTAHPSTASVLITVLLCNSPLLCSFNMGIKGLILADTFFVNRFLFLSLGVPKFNHPVCQGSKFLFSQCFSLHDTDCWQTKTHTQGRLIYLLHQRSNRSSLYSTACRPSKRFWAGPSRYWVQ